MPNVIPDISKVSMATGGETIAGNPVCNFYKKIS